VAVKVSGATHKYSILPLVASWYVNENRGRGWTKMGKTGRIFVLSLALLFSLTTGSAEGAKPAGTKQMETQQNISEVEKQVSQMEVGLLKYFTIILIGGGLALWILVYNTLKSSLARRLERHGSRMMREAREEIDAVKWLGDSERENAIGAFWEELYEHPPEGAPRVHAYLNLALEAYGRTLDSSKKLNQEEYQRYICIYKNNMAHCLSLRMEAGIGSPDDKERALEYINYAVANGDKYLDCGYRFRETRGWVILRFAEDNQQEKEEGHKLIRETLQRSDIPVGWRETRELKYRSVVGETDPNAHLRARHPTESGQNAVS